MFHSHDDPLGDRTMQALFAGWRTGSIAWLAELDFIQDDLVADDDATPVYEDDFYAYEKNRKMLNDSVLLYKIA